MILKSVHLLHPGSPWPSACLSRFPGLNTSKIITMGTRPSAGKRWWPGCWIPWAAQMGCGDCLWEASVTRGEEEHLVAQ